MTGAAESARDELLLRWLGRADYARTWQAMRDFVDARERDSQSELWLLEHDPVFTQGQAGKPEHLLDPGDIPVVQTDRGGQVTYHGPGQLVGYLLLDLKRLGIGVRSLVTAIEDSIIGLLAEQGIDAESRRDAPGVYVDNRKIAALGLRVRHGYTYHGLSLNVAMDTEPFQRINPCGYAGLEVAQLADFGIDWDVREAGERLLPQLQRQLRVDLRD